MLIEKVKKLKPLQRMLYFIKEREAVRIKKEAGEPKPWTEDIILQSYRFCNVRRMDDKVSKWLYENWYKPYFNHKYMLQVVALARFVNKPETLNHLTNKTLGLARPDWTWVKNTMNNLKTNGVTIFNGAYMVRGNDGENKVSSVVDYYVAGLKDVKLNTDSMEESHTEIMKCYGLGSFMAGQLVADLRWATDGKWLDRMSWAPLGPGSKRGMNRLLEQPLNGPMNQACFETNLAWLIQECKDNLPDSITSRLEAHDYQNCCCEYDKMERTLFDNRKPKQKYSGAG